MHSIRVDFSVYIMKPSTSTNSFVDGKGEPFISRQKLIRIHERQEAEAILELRKNAISHWLKQLPESRATMWTTVESPDISLKSLGDTQVDQTSQTLDGYDIEEFPTDKPLRQKSLPIENAPPVTNQSSFKIRQMERSKKLLCRPIVHFTEKWMSDEEQPSPGLPEQQFRSQEAIKNETCDRRGDEYSVISECVEEVYNKEDTAYDGSRCDSKVAHPVVSPPAVQSIGPRFIGDIDVTAQMDRSSFEMDRWMPSEFVRGLIGMVFNPGLLFEEESEVIEVHQTCPMQDRVLRRFYYRKQKRRGRSTPRVRSRSVLRLRMNQAARKRREIKCKLEHPPAMKEMASRCFELNAPVTLRSTTQAVEYTPPDSVTGLSDFECYMGSLVSSFVNQGNSHPAIGHCNTWILEKLLCFLGAS